MAIAIAIPLTIAIAPILAQTLWDDPAGAGEMFWEEDTGLSLENGPSTEIYSCNTQKDKDKRICRHTFGVLFGCYPCGVGKYLKKYPK